MNYSQTFGEPYPVHVYNCKHRKDYVYFSYRFFPNVTHDIAMYGNGITIENHPESMNYIIAFTDFVVLQKQTEGIINFRYHGDTNNVMNDERRRNEFCDL